MAYPPNIASQEVIQAEHFNELVRKYRQFWNGPEWNPDGDTPTSSPTFDTSHHTDTERHKGWGQAALVPSEVVSGTIITAENMNNLVAQINAGIFHIEEDPLTLIPKFSAAAIITVPAYTQIMDRLDNIIEARKFELEIINDSLGSVSSVHTNSWSDDLYSEYKATFNNYTEARHYFNSGGQLWLTLESGTQTGGNDPANINWQNMFEKLGEVRIGAIETTASGTGSPSLGGIQGFYSILSTGATVTIFDAAGYHALSTELLLKLANLPNVTALKISTIDVSIIETMMLANKDLKILAGVDTVTVHAGLAGAIGGITGVGCIFPKASVTMQEYVTKGEWTNANKISQALNSLSYLDAQPLLMEYLKFAMGIHHNDVAGGLRTLGKKLTQQEIDDVQARYILAKERLEVLNLIS